MNATTNYRMPVEKYTAFTPVDLPDRRWPGKTIDKAPIWCSVDLRDGNQALVEPMGSERKREMFATLVKMGFKEIEIGFPAASQTDFAFCRELINNKLIPDDVSIQVLTQAREDLIRRTFEGIKGAKRAIVHLYNSTSELQRRVVFRMDRAGARDLAVKGTRLVRAIRNEHPDVDVRFEYSPESFTGTELDFAVEVCDAVADEWGATADEPIIINLPSTVEMSTPNIYADQIEWCCRAFKDRRRMIVSVHPHNDRGTAVAAAELALLAGADRVEGTLFGNGERTGNVDVVNMALNMFSQGVDPELVVHDINELVRVSVRCTNIDMHPRHPYAGDLVFTAFSGSHQDAINKGLKAMESSNSGKWEVPYLPIDPRDLGRDYEAIIRINSQSGKGGVAYVLERERGFKLPRRLQMEFSKRIQAVADETGKEISPEIICREFEREYLERDRPISYVDHTIHTRGRGAGDRGAQVIIERDGERRVLTGRGNGAIAAVMDALQSGLGIDLHIVDYSEHAIGSGTDARAVAFYEVRDGGEGTWFGVGVDTDTMTACVRAIISAVNRFV